MYWCVCSHWWPLYHNNYSMYFSVTAIIAEHSFFLWKQKPSTSSAPFELAIQKFNLSADLPTIKTAIKEASQFKTRTRDQEQALVKIALENRLCEFLICQVFKFLLSFILFSFINVLKHLSTIPWMQYMFLLAATMMHFCLLFSKIDNVIMSFQPSQGLYIYQLLLFSSSTGCHSLKFLHQLKNSKINGIMLSRHLGVWGRSVHTPLYCLVNFTPRMTSNFLNNFDHSLD